MAITYLGDGGRGAGTNNVTYSIPSGTQNGDLLLLVIETANQTVTEPGEWLDVPSSPQGIGTAGGTTATRLKIMYRWVDGTSINTTVTDPGNHQVGAILAFRGVDTTNPFNASAGSTKSTSNTSCTFPSITTTVADCWVLLAEAHALPDSNVNGQTSGQTMASLSDLTEQVDYNSNAGNGGGFSVATGLKATAGSTGTGSATHSTNTADATITLALAPLPEAQDLTPNRYDNSNSFFTPTVTRGTATVAPDRYNNAQAFYAPTVTTIGPAQNLDPSLVINSQAFYEPAVAATYSLAPALVTNASAFYAATVAASYSLSPALYTNSSAFYTPAVTSIGGTQDLTPSLFANGQTFYAQTVSTSYSLAPSLVTNAGTVYSHSISATYTLEPSVTGNVNAFPDATVTTSKLLTAGLTENVNSFFAPVVSSGALLIAPDRYDNAQSFYAPTVDRGAVSVSAPLVSNVQAFYSPSVSSGGSQSLVQIGWVDSGWVEDGWVGTPFFNVNQFFTAKIKSGQAPAGSNKKRNKLVEIDGVMYSVPERDIPALLEAKLLNRRPPSTAKAEQPAKPPKVIQKVSKKPAAPYQAVDEALVRYQDLLKQLEGQAQMKAILDRVAARVLSEMEDEDDAVALLLLL